MTFSGGFLLIGLWLVFWFVLSISLIKQIQLIKRTHTTWISALPDTGRVEVVGKVQGESISSPMGEKPCVVWQVEVLKVQKSKNRTSWKRIFVKTSSNSFMVDDGTGIILVNPEGAELILDEGELIEEAGDVLWSKLEKLGFDQRDEIKGSDSLQVYERRVTEGGEIYVAGHIQPGKSGITLRGKPSDPLAISTQSEGATLSKLYGQLVMKGVTTFFVVLGAAIIYYGLLRG
jgi:hypothetical protein